MIVRCADGDATGAVGAGAADDGGGNSAAGKEGLSWGAGEGAIAIAALMLRMRKENVGEN